ncbi:MAG: LON peptidase substrate-binding domain-containing protein [Acidiferrobacterales bacterium]
MKDLPLFPLHAVLYPGGRFQLRVFEKRYMDMVTTCLKTEQPFGICLIRAGDEVGAAAQAHSIGTLAHPVEWEMSQPGILDISVRGGQRFRTHATRVCPDQLLRGDIEPLPEEPREALSAAQRQLGALLARFLTDFGEQYYFPPLRLDDAVWVAYRLAELLPAPNALKQRVLEQDGAEHKLGLLAAALGSEQRGLA